METKIVSVDLDALSYDVFIGADLIGRAPELLPFDIKGKSAFLVSDMSVKDFAEALQRALIHDGAAKAEIMYVRGGEKAKSFEKVEKLLNWMLGEGIARDSAVFAIGGGVIGDLTGFCASIVMRGVPYVHVPTTLLSQVDSSVGGKTGVNMKQGKNLVGSFYQPAAVLADIYTLQTLPRRELLAGYAEIVKYGLINDAKFFEWLEGNGPRVCALEEEALAYAIETSVWAKTRIVQADEREKGERALLNLGHTFGHALESAAKYDGRLIHGEAVAIGICMAFDLSSRMGLCSRDAFERVERHFDAVGLPTRASQIEPDMHVGVDRLMEIMGHDKKVYDGKITYVLAKDIGEAFLTSDVPEQLVRDVLRDSLGSDKMRIRERWKSAFTSHSH